MYYVMEINEAKCSEYEKIKMLLVKKNTDEYHEKGINITLTNGCNYIKFDLNYKIKKPKLNRTCDGDGDEKTKLKSIKFDKYNSADTPEVVQNIWNIL